MLSRAIHRGTPLPVRGPTATFLPLPEVSSKIYARYKQCCEQRLLSFNGPHRKQTVDREDTDWEPSPLRQHELRHDAESHAWLLFWSGVQACPENGHKVHIPKLQWQMLFPARASGKEKLQDNRDSFLGDLIARCEVLHPGYSALAPLFQDIADTIYYDHHWAKDENQRKPEYVHEALQRLILNFVVDHYDDAFMDLKKKDEYRKIEGETTAHLSVPATEARRSGPKNSSASSNSKRHRSDQAEVLLRSADSGNDELKGNAGASGHEDERPVSASIIICCPRPYT